MSNKKQIIEESFGKMKKIVEARISEQPTAQQQAAQPQQQAQSQQQTQSKQQVQQANAKLDAQADQAMKKAVANIEDYLEKFLQTSGDKDGEIDVAGEKQQGQQVAEGDGKKYLTLNEELQQEALGAIAGGIALSAPTVIDWIGKGTKWLGKKADSKKVQKIGSWLSEKGHAWHKAYLKPIQRAVAKFMPPDPETGEKRGIDDPKVKKIANIIFLTVVAGMGAAAAHGATAAAAQGHTAVAGTEGALAGIKTSEVGGEVLKYFREILPNLGIS